MVYCGKPSKGCQMCRTRRIKCDETKPTCNQCHKSRRQCPGYKHDFDIVFRNETNATERRARRGLGFKKGVRRDHITFVSESGTKQEPFEDDANSMELSTNESINGPPGYLSVPVDDQAPCFFITNFVRMPQGGDTRGAFDFIVPIIKSEARDSHISLAFSAVSLASLANRPNSKSSNLMLRAIAQYGKAMRAINVALQNRSLQKTDATLASILLLGFFETITTERTNVLAWGSHIDGAVQLTKMRGKKQLRTKTGTALFMAVRQQMLINCMSSSKPPQAGANWWISLQDGPQNHPENFISAIFLRVAEARFEVNALLANSPRNAESFKKVLDIMKRCQDMDLEFQEWKDTLPKEWLPNTVAWVDNVPGGDLLRADVYPGRVDLYTDLILANVWNLGRTCRLFIIGLIVRCVAWVGYPVDYRTTPEYAYCSKVGVEVVSDIVASIPFHLGWHMDEAGHLKAGDLSSDFIIFPNDNHVTSPKALGGLYCIWPLFCVTSSDYATDSQRTWIKGRMRLIADVMGLNQAKVIGGFDLRLPSMIVRRDIMAFAPPTPAQIAAYMAAQQGGGAAHTPTPSPASAVPSTPSKYVPITTSTISRIASEEPQAQSHTAGGYSNYVSSQQYKSSGYTYGKSEVNSSPTARIEHYVHTPTSPQQQMDEDAKREEWEKEKQSLLKKASNFGGESTETIIGTYLAI